MSDELTAGSSQSTTTNLRSASISDLLSGKADLNDQFALKLNTSWTWDAATPATAGTSFGSSGGNTFALSLRASYDPNEHWSFVLGPDYSPPSTTLADAPLSFTTRTGTSESADAQLSSRSSSWGGKASVSYDTAGERRVEGSGTLAASYTSYDTTQRYTRFVDKHGGTLDAGMVQSYCASHKCPRAWLTAINAVPFSLGQVKLDASGALTLGQLVDVGLEGAWYLYTQDPTQVGYWSTATAGRSTSGGGGAPLSPLLVTIIPSLTLHRGPIIVELDFRWGDYVGGGYDLQLTLRGDLKLGERWKVWVQLQGQSDVDAAGEQSKAGYLSLGARLKF